MVRLLYACQSVASKLGKIMKARIGTPEGFAFLDFPEAIEFRSASFLNAREVIHDGKQRSRFAKGANDFRQTLIIRNRVHSYVILK
jgi:hypothetical protein